MNGVLGLAGWRWLFILEGIPSIIAGVASFWLIPDYPESCRFLKGRQKEIARARLPEHTPTQATLKFERLQLVESFKIPQLYIFCIMAFCLSTQGYAAAYFIPRIIVAMGFSSYNAQLLNVGLSLTGAVYNLFVNLLSDRIKERGYLIIITLIPPIIGWSLLATIQGQLAPGQNYGLLYLTSIAIACNPLIFTYAVQNVRGATKSATISAVVIASANIGGVTGGQVYQAGDGPLFKTGHTVNAALLGVICLGVFAIKFVNKFKPEWAVQADDVAE